MVIHISGRRWFQRTYGNTYHSVTVYIDGEKVWNSGQHYGYGEQYVQTAMEWLQSKGHIAMAGHYEKPRIYAERTGIKITTEVSDVAREKDL